MSLNDTDEWASRIIDDLVKDSKKDKNSDVLSKFDKATGRSCDLDPSSSACNKAENASKCDSSFLAEVNSKIIGNLTVDTSNSSDYLPFSTAERNFEFKSNDTNDGLYFVATKELHTDDFQIKASDTDEKSAFGATNRKGFDMYEEHNRIEQVKDSQCKNDDDKELPFRTISCDMFDINKEQNDKETYDNQLTLSAEDGELNHKLEKNDRSRMHKNYKTIVQIKDDLKFGMFAGYRNDIAAICKDESSVRGKTGGKCNYKYQLLVSTADDELIDARINDNLTNVHDETGTYNVCDTLSEDNETMLNGKSDLDSVHKNKNAKKEYHNSWLIDAVARKGLFGNQVTDKDSDVYKNKNNQGQYVNLQFGTFAASKTNTLDSYSADVSNVRKCHKQNPAAIRIKGDVAFKRNESDKNAGQTIDDPQFGNSVANKKTAVDAQCSDMNRKYGEYVNIEKYRDHNLNSADISINSDVSFKMYESDKNAGQTINDLQFENSVADKKTAVDTRCSDVEGCDNIEFIDDHQTDMHPADNKFRRDLKKGSNPGHEECDDKENYVYNSQQIPEVDKKHSLNPFENYTYNEYAENKNKEVYVSEVLASKNPPTVDTLRSGDSVDGSDTWFSYESFEDMSLTSIESNEIITQSYAEIKDVDSPLDSDVKLDYTFTEVSKSETDLLDRIDQKAKLAGFSGVKNEGEQIEDTRGSKSVKDAYMEYFTKNFIKEELEFRRHNNGLKSAELLDERISHMDLNKQSTAHGRTEVKEIEEDIHHLSIDNFEKTSNTEEQENGVKIDFLTDSENTVKDLRIKDLEEDNESVLCASVEDVFESTNLDCIISTGNAPHGDIEREVDNSPIENEDDLSLDERTVHENFDLFHEDESVNAIGSVLKMYRNVCRMFEDMCLRPVALILAENVDFLMFMFFISIYTTYMTFAKINNVALKPLKRKCVAFLDAVKRGSDVILLQYGRPSDDGLNVSESNKVTSGQISKDTVEPKSLSLTVRDICQEIGETDNSVKLYKTKSTDISFQEVNSISYFNNVASLTGKQFLVPLRTERHVAKVVVPADDLVEIKNVDDEIVHFYFNKKEQSKMEDLNALDGEGLSENSAVDKQSYSPFYPIEKNTSFLSASTSNVEAILNSTERDVLDSGVVQNNKMSSYPNIYNWELPLNHPYLEKPASNITLPIKCLDGNFPDDLTNASMDVNLSSVSVGSANLKPKSESACMITEEFITDDEVQATQESDAQFENQSPIPSASKDFDSFTDEINCNFDADDQISIVKLIGGVEILLANQEALERSVRPVEGAAENLPSVGYNSIFPQMSAENSADIDERNGFPSSERENSRRSTSLGGRMSSVIDKWKKSNIFQGVKERRRSKENKKHSKK